MFKTVFISDLADLIYPVACVGCQQPLVSHEEMLCTSCLSELPRTHYHEVAENEIIRIFTGRCQLRRASAYLYFTKGGIVQSLMHEFKYRGKKEIGSYMGRLMGKDLAQSRFCDDIDFLVPVPLHKKKLTARGYNQSEVLAHGISEETGVPVSTDHLIRESFSATQTKKSRFARWKNVESIFTVQNPADFKNKHLMLVDDVITTGSTIEASVTKLAAIPGVQVSLLTLAMAKD